MLMINQQVMLAVCQQVRFLVCQQVVNKICWRCVNKLSTCYDGDLSDYFVSYKFRLGYIVMIN